MHVLLHVLACSPSMHVLIAKFSCRVSGYWCSLSWHWCYAQNSFSFSLIGHSTHDAAVIRLKLHLHGYCLSCNWAYDGSIYWTLPKDNRIGQAKLLFGELVTVPNLDRPLSTFLKSDRLQQKLVTRILCRRHQKIKYIRQLPTMNPEVHVHLVKLLRRLLTSMTCRDSSFYTSWHNLTTVFSNQSLLSLLLLLLLMITPLIQ